MSDAPERIWAVPEYNCTVYMSGNSPITKANELVRSAADRIEKLEALVNKAENIFSNCLVVSGSCCCGEDMSHHSQYSGHTPTDHGEYQVQLWMKDLKNVR